MLDEVIVHVGLPKAGSTSIQRALFKHRTFLHDEEATLYPAISLSHTLPVFSAFSENKFARHPNVTMSNSNDAEADLKQAKLSSEFKDSILKEIQSGLYRKLIISGEGISKLTHKELDNFGAWLLGIGKSLKIIFVLRDPVLLTISGIQQILKSGRSLAELYNKCPYPSCQVNMEKFRQVFGRDAVQVLFLEDSNLQAGGVVAAFCELCGLSAANSQFIASQQEVSNVSLTFEAANLLDELNRLRAPSSQSEFERVKFKLELDFLRNLKGTKFTVPQVVLENIHENTRDDVSYLKSEFGHHAYDLDISRYESRECMDQLFVRSMASEVNAMMRVAASQQILAKTISQLVKGDFEDAQKTLATLAELEGKDGALPKLSNNMQTLTRRLARRGNGKAAHAR